MIKKLRQLMKQKGITFYQLHKITGIGTNNLSALNTGKVKSLSFDNMVKIADALDVSLDEFREPKS